MDCIKPLITPKLKDIHSLTSLVAHILYNKDFFISHFKFSAVQEIDRIF